MKKLAKLGTVWTARALLRYIDDSFDPPRWVTVAKRVDTPQAVKAASLRALDKHPTKTIWIHRNNWGDYFSDKAIL